MNALEGTITQISTDENLALVGVDTPIDEFSVLLLDTPQQDLQVGVRSKVYFKPTQVLLMAQSPHSCTHNCFASRIAHIQKNTILSLVSLEDGVDVLVATRAFENLGLREGDECWWGVSAGDILLES